MLVMSWTLSGTWLYHLRPDQSIAAIAGLTDSDAQVRQFPLYDSKGPRCGVDWQDDYKAMHRDILGRRGSQRFAVAVGVEAGLTGVFLCCCLCTCKSGLAAVIYIQAFQPAHYSWLYKLARDLMKCSESRRESSSRYLHTSERSTYRLALRGNLRTNADRIVRVLRTRSLPTYHCKGIHVMPVATKTFCWMG